MNENIDLTKILKDCPNGYKFYSSVYGDVEFIGVLHDSPVPYHEREDEYLIPLIKKHKYPIKLMTDSGEYYVSREGRHRYSVGECTLFPSREQRDWSKFTAPWYKKEKFDPKTLKPFDKVLVKDFDETSYWTCNLFSHYNKNKGFYYCSSVPFDVCIPYNDNTKHLVGTIEEAPEFYRYWED